MAQQIKLSLLIAFLIGFSTSPVYGGDIISCDSFENCPDGSVPLTNALLALEARMDALEADNAALEADNSALHALVTTLQQELAANSAADAEAKHDRYTDAESIAAVGPHFSGSHTDLTNIVADQHHAKYTDAEAVTAVGDHSPDFSTMLAGVSRITDPNTTEDTLRFSDMNVQIVSGSGMTDGTTTGTGNLIIGYNEKRNQQTDDRTGSHMLVIGTKNSYSEFGGLVVGSFNTVSAGFASVSGGSANTASGSNASISGGSNNIASSQNASVSGGWQNTASTSFAPSVSGGLGNTASGDFASVSGGDGNQTNAQAASISGGQRNTASGESASISGGQDKTAVADYCVVGDDGVDC